MKLYTIEQVRKAYDAGMQFIGEDKGSPIEFFNSLTPIELPTKEQMKNKYFEIINNEVLLKFLTKQQGERLKWYYENYFITSQINKQQQTTK